ncbi:uncharacterized protein ACHE_20035A [Aspergillus chevalieri]|uniref:Uncharacterized protein n=1 Tax=Aspergillus chevalieri TaxID=182096 RepID=A0A7R7VHQ5_ASPCH|nr:uncharacterized protein ACHE_20035A [Aspergillus chevalieri]BCR84577.1 hypothetical protein ACHE_20035A [Aspergillus chevalieri]
MATNLLIYLLKNGDSDPLPKRRKVEDDSWRLQANLIRVVDRNGTLYNSAAARARANLLSTVEHPNDESLVRSAHDPLRDCDPV